MLFRSSVERGRRTSLIVDPADGRLPALTPRSGRLTPVLVRFLSTTMIQQINGAIRRYIRGQRALQRVQQQVAEARPQRAAQEAAIRALFTKAQQDRGLRETFKRLQVSARPEVNQ